jgi:hypothetical protein
MRAVTPIALLVLCGGLAIPVTADAKVKPSPTQIALTDSTSETISGTVSGRAKCGRERTVRLYDLDTDVAFHTTTTDRTGRFSIAVSDIPPDSSGFRVRAETVTIGNRECEAASVDVEADFVTLSGGPHDGAFTGVLNSSVPACEPGRVISLYEISSGEPVFAGFDIADSSGAWAIAQAAGTYEVRADPVFVAADGGFIFCRAVASFPWTFEDPPEE